MINNKIRPVVNEKSIFSLELENEQYTFDVSNKLAKKDIKKLLESTFLLKVDKLTVQAQPRARKPSRLARGTKKTTNCLKWKRVRVIFKKPAPFILQYYE